MTKALQILLTLLVAKGLGSETSDRLRGFEYARQAGTCRSGHDHDDIVHACSLL